ncbi:hypothetical protein ACFSKW_49300 [Nonomuraea mangrovi]|uniref:Uncharacterized protein n=1 Tax=Nonomuraea mangrovi TaxID=2316207 RepID=A0ABW4TDP9_9ACTN
MARRPINRRTASRYPSFALRTADGGVLGFTTFQVAVHIPPKKAEPGRFRVVASYSGVTGGSGR